MRKSFGPRPEVVMKVRPPEDGEAELMRDGGWLVGFIWPGQNREIVDRLAKKKATVFAMDSVPRITRAQKMDTLSAMANIAGYRAIIEAANNFPRFFHRPDHGRRTHRSCERSS
jgi:NAD(P) transhydrogenase subunit alpha